jgi:S-adenosylmethionine:tRNA-ribosyltransferase-isomerase (queuine synthetase)
MQLSDFDFDLPETLIAQEPTSIREHSNLLIAAANHEIVGFYNLPEYLIAGDLLVFNNQLPRSLTKCVDQLLLLITLLKNNKSK